MADERKELSVELPGLPALSVAVTTVEGDGGSLSKGEEQKAEKGQ